MGIPSKSSWPHRARALCLVGTMALVVPGLLWGGGLLASAQSATSGATFAQQYLSALGPAGTAISTVEAKLKALPVTASVAQVKAVVAPLPKALDPLEALIQSGAPSPTGTSLQSLGKPAILGQYGVRCNVYSTPPSGGRLVVDGTGYKNGFQMTAPITCIEFNAQYTWKIGTKYTSLKAQVGYDASNACTGSSIRFLGNSGEHLPVVSNGRSVGTVRLPATGLASVSVELTHQAQLTLQILFTCHTDLSNIDVVNDQLS